MSKFCSNCGTSIDVEKKYCENCGTSIVAQDLADSNMQVFPNSQYGSTNNQNIPSNNQYIPPNINVNVQNTNTLENRAVLYGINPNSDKSRLVCLLLWLFLGYIGAHRYYVGKIGSGILYTLTIGLFGVGWIFDFLLIITGSFKDGNNRPVK